jgi:hypothetical protein
MIGLTVPGTAMRIRTTIEIDRPSSETFRFVATDFVDTYPKYCREVDKVELDSPDPVAMGTTGTITGHVRGRAHSVRFKVTAYETERLLSFESWSSEYPDISSGGSYVFDGTPMGKTRLSIIADVEFRGFVSLLGVFLAKPFVSAGARADARRLKALLEAG